ncbi:hypothetical protein D0429_06705 [Staphylococcus auricularis]|nr:hypothetical protein [Staphylococcus auricularis]
MDFQRLFILLLYNRKEPREIGGRELQLSFAVHSIFQIEKSPEKEGKKTPYQNMIVVLVLNR